MTLLAYLLIVLPLALTVYTYLGYPVILKLLARRQKLQADPQDPAEWPLVSITVPVYNEASQIDDLIASLLALDYPPDRRQILIVSDASDDGTDERVQEYATAGIELLRMPRRGGKTLAENAAASLLRGDIVVNTDASIRIAPGALKRLVAAFSNPTVGAASGRDVSVARMTIDANPGEARYVGYEMGVRALETRVGGIVGASGCFYAIRSHLHRVPLPDWLSRDFASAMTARAHGYRTVSVDDAICYVPRTSSLRSEYRRKVRTMTRGIQTIAYMRRMLNPLRYGRFSWMLFSHKICRWLIPWSGVALLIGLLVLGATERWALWVLGTAVGANAVLALSWWALYRGRSVHRLLHWPTFVLAGNVAALVATIDAARGDRNATWEPTRRENITAGAGAGVMT